VAQKNFLRLNPPDQRYLQPSRMTRRHVRGWPVAS